MRWRNRNLDYRHCSDEVTSYQASRVLVVMQLPSSLCNAHDNILPCVLLESRGLMVVHKPPGWDVHATQEFGIGANLSVWFKSSFLEQLHLGLQDKDRSAGFTHRLDAICSGLLLAFTIHEAHSVLH